MTLSDSGARGRGWLRYLTRKLGADDDDWSKSGHPSSAWDNRSGPPTTNWYRFDAIGIATTVALAARSGTADREWAVAALDGLVDRLCQYHGFNEWGEQRGSDPGRADYPVHWRGTLIPESQWGSYDTPGWASNGVQPAGYQPNPIEAEGAIYYKGFLNYVLGLRSALAPQRSGEEAMEIVYDDEHRFWYTHSEINAVVTKDFSDALQGRALGLCCEVHKLWPL